MVVQLSVPLRSVTKGSNLCMLACSLMVLEYYDDVLPTAESEKEVLAFEPFTCGNNERHSQGMALWLIGKGYSISYCHNDLGVIDRDTDGLSENDVAILRTKLAQLPDAPETAYGKKKLAHDIRLIEAGASFSTTLPDAAFIDRHLEQGMPVICTVRHSMLRLEPEARGNHAIVITGGDGRHYQYNDCNRSAPETIESMKLIRAWYAAGAYAMVIRPKGQNNNPARPS